MRSFFIVSLCSLTLFTPSCSKKTDSVAEAEAAVTAAQQVATVEFTGEWRSTVEATQYFFVAQDKPCRPFTPKVATFGAIGLPKQGALAARFFVPQGSIGHACIFAKDGAGKIVGVASYEKNPVTMQGAGTITVGSVNLVVEAL